jgi:hypothetical protein
MGDEARNAPGGVGGAGGREQRYETTHNPADRNEHRHGDVVHSHEHKGPHEHGDDYEYDEAHDPESWPPDVR